MTELRILTLQEKVPPLDDLIFGNHTTEQLLAEISERGRKLSAKECCEYFCTPPNKSDILKKAMEGSGVKWGQYSHNSAEVIARLESLGRIIIPKEKRELAPAFDTVNQNQAVITDKKLLPIRDVKTKIGPLEIEKGKSIDEAIAEGIKKVTVNHMLGAYKFQGTIDKVWRIFSFTDIIRGIIYNAAIHTAVWAQPPTSNLEYGLCALVTQVPRFHEGKTSREPTEYSVSFKRIPAYKETKKVPGNGFDITLASSAPRESYELKPYRERQKGQKPELVTEQRWDHYVIMAYERTAKKLEEEELKVIRPYPQITADQIRFYWKMIHKGLIREEEKLKNMLISAEEFIFWKYKALTKAQNQ